MFVRARVGDGERKGLAGGRVLYGWLLEVF